MFAATHTTRNLLTTLTFAGLIASPLLLQALQEQAQQSALENRRLSPPPTLTNIVSDWSGFPDQVNAWLRDHFGLRRTYLQIGFSVDRILSASAGLKAVRGDDGWLFNALHGALAQHRGLLPFAAGEADTWLDGIMQMKATAEASGAVFIATITPNKHTIYPEKLSSYPRRAAGETRLDEVQRRAQNRELPLVDLRASLTAAKSTEKVYYQTDTHWTELGAYYGFLELRAALIAHGVEVPNLPDVALTLSEESDFRGDLYGLLGEEEGAPETVLRVKVDPVAEKAGSILIIGDSFTGQLRRYFDATFEAVTFAKNNAGAPDLRDITPGAYDVVLFQIVERYLSRALTPVVSNQPNSGL